MSKITKYVLFLLVVALLVGNILSIIRNETGDDYSNSTACKRTPCICEEDDPTFITYEEEEGHCIKSQSDADCKLAVIGLEEIPFLSANNAFFDIEYPNDTLCGKIVDVLVYINHNGTWRLASEGIDKVVKWKMGLSQVRVNFTQTVGLLLKFELKCINDLFNKDEYCAVLKISGIEVLHDFFFANQSKTNTTTTTSTATTQTSATTETTMASTIMTTTRITTTATQTTSILEKTVTELETNSEPTDSTKTLILKTQLTTTLKKYAVPDPETDLDSKDKITLVIVCVAGSLVLIAIFACILFGLRRKKINKPDKNPPPPSIVTNVIPVYEDVNDMNGYEALSKIQKNIQMSKFYNIDNKTEYSEIPNSGKPDKHMRDSRNTNEIASNVLEKKHALDALDEHDLYEPPEYHVLDVEDNCTNQEPSKYEMLEVDGKIPNGIHGKAVSNNEYNSNSDYDEVIREVNNREIPEYAVVNKKHR